MTKVFISLDGGTSWQIANGGRHVSQGHPRAGLEQQVVADLPAPMPYHVGDAPTSRRSRRRAARRRYQPLARTQVADEDSKSFDTSGDGRRPITAS